MDLVQEFQQLAATLGGQLQTPRLPWKYPGLKSYLAGQWQTGFGETITATSHCSSRRGIKPCIMLELVIWSVGRLRLNTRGYE